MRKPLNLTYRSNQREMLDESYIPSDLLIKNLIELDILNRTTGGHATSLEGLKHLITDHHKHYQLVDLGCGGGDTLKAMANWSRLNNFHVIFTGIDINSNTIDYLNSHCKEYPEITGINANYVDYLNKNEYIDIVHCSLFCHHLKDDELLNLFIYFRKHINIGFIINDLQRHWLTYYCAWLFTRLLNGSILAKNDGPISVRRAFKYDEFKTLLAKANIKNFSINKTWFFRFLIIGKTEKNVS